MTNEYLCGGANYNLLKNKRKNIKIITIIIFLILIIVTFSFALFNPSINLLGRRNIKISKCELDINFKESDELMLVSKYPISKEDALKYNAKDITITNNSTCDMVYYKLTIKDLSNSSINKNKINYQLIDKNDNSEIVDNNPDNFLIEDSLAKGNSKSYTIRLWIDESTTNTDLYVNGDTTKPIGYKYTLSFESSDDIIENVIPNAPELANNMIPVYYDNGVWKKADSTNKNNNWYDYSKKKWANAVTVSMLNNTRDDLLKADVGTEIPMSRILTMQVWIPRFKYRVWNYNLDGTKTIDKEKEIKIRWEEGTSSTGKIKCVDNVSKVENSVSELCTLNRVNCTDSICNGNYYTHPAFTFDDQELTGFWMSKFEATGTSNNIKSVPNESPYVKQIVSSFFSSIIAMKNTNNQYGFDSSVDVHMIKNMEWGAVAYLSYSKYGTCTDGVCQRMGINNYSGKKTGCGISINEYAQSTICNEYNTISGQSASTTGNVYGVYDMSGGVGEYTVSALLAPDGVNYMTGATTSWNSGFSGIIFDDGNYSTYTTSISFPDDKYIEKYSFSNSEVNPERGKLGDATKEVSLDQKNTWKGQYMLPPRALNAFLVLGLSYQDADSGVFRGSRDSGGANSNYGTRFSIIIKK